MVCNPVVGHAPRAAPANTSPKRRAPPSHRSRRIVAHPLANPIRNRDQLVAGQCREFLAEEQGGAARRLLLNDLAANHLIVERIALAMGCEMDMQMRDPVTEDIDVDEVGAARFPERTAALG